jgi:hypothetical protein
MLSRRTVLTASAGLAAGATVAACSPNSGKNSKWNSPGGGSDPSGAPAGESPAGNTTFTVTPAADTKDVSPGEAVTVSVEGGTLQSVAVTANGKTVAGTIAGDQRSWKSTGALA